MSYSVFFEENAINDIQEAVSYYDIKKEGLGEVFYTSLENAIETIIINPNFQIRYKDYVGLPLKNSLLLCFITLRKKPKKFTLFLYLTLLKIQIHITIYKLGLNIQNKEF